MPYREPKLQIFQDFEPALAAGAAPLFACYVGPNYELHRFTEEAEKAFMADYDEDTDNTYAWPDHIAGGVIDVAGATVWIEDTLVRYYTSFASADQITDNGNKILSNVIFKSNAYSDRTTSAFGDRDVEVGDIVRLRWVDTGSSSSGPSSQQTFESVVSGFQADIIPGSTTPEGDLQRIAGPGSITAGYTEDPGETTSQVPTKFTTAYDVASYDGLVDGYPSDTYNIRVDGDPAFGGVGGLDGTVLTITSENNDIPSTVELGVDVLWDGAKYPVPLGARGAILELTDSGVGSVVDGQNWNVLVSQTYTEVDVNEPTEFAVTGPYTGDINTQYIMEVVLGGTVGTDSLIVDIKTNNGADIEDTITIPSGDFPPSQVDYAFGIRGVSISMFSGTQWVTGEVITFDMLGESEGSIHTLCLADPIPASAGTDLDVDLFVRDTVEFPTSYSTLSSDDIEIDREAQIISDLLGTPEVMRIFDGKLYVDYRELRTEDCNELRAISSQAGGLELLGPATQSNPLSLAGTLGLSESSGIAAYYLAICSDDLAGYTEALDILTENDDVYGLVPLTNDQAVKDAFHDHISERSNPLNNQWRNLYVANDEPRIKSIYTELSGGDDILATVEELSVGLYRKVVSVGALFATNGVDAGDKVRINYTPDGDGGYTFDEYTVDRLDGEECIVLVESLPGPIVVPIKIEVWRNQTKGDYADALADHAQQYNDRRVVSVYADNPVESDGTPLELFYVAAALSGQRSGAAPHAPLSQIDLTSINLDPLLKFSRDQLNVIAGGGNWIVTKDFDGRVYTRHQVTTYQDVDDLNQREQSKTTNLDHISRDFYLNTRDLFGQSNVSPEMLSLIRQRINTLIERISNRPYPAKLGPQMLNAEIIRLAVDETLRDTIIVEIDPGLPDPLNTLVIRFTVS
jgi:hypothetical protein